RALDISVNFSHDGRPLNCSENISKSGTETKTIKDFFYAFYNSLSHKRIMLSSSLAGSLGVDAFNVDYRGCGFGFHSVIHQGALGDASRVEIKTFAVQLFEYGGSLNP